MIGRQNPRGRARFEWIEAALKSSALSEGEKVLAARLGLHLNDETGRCDPSNATLSRGTSFSERHVKKLRASLVRKGWLDFDRNAGGKGRSTQHFLLQQTVSGGTPFPGAETVSNGSAYGGRQTSERCPAGHPNNNEHSHNPKEPISSGDFAGEERRSDRRQGHAKDPVSASGSWQRSRDGWRDAQADLSAKNRADFAGDQDCAARDREAVQPLPSH